MKAGKGIAAVLGILLLLSFSFGSAAPAATPNVVGTWTGSGKAVQSDGYASFTATMKISGRNLTLFKGTLTIKSGTHSKQHGLSGCISGSKVYMTIYDPVPGDTDSFIDATLATSTKMTGILRTVNSAAGNITLIKK